MTTLLPLLKAFAWLRWRLFVNGLRRGRRRDIVERLSIFGEIAAPILAGLLVAPLALGLAVGAFAAGWLLGTGATPTVATVVGTAVRFALAVGTVALVVAPVTRSVQGASSDFSRYVLLPIPAPLLHLLEVASSFADPWILIPVPALLALPAGLLAAGSGAAALLSLAAGLALLAVLACLASASGFLFHLLFRNRRRGEMVFLVFMLLVSISGMIPVAIEHRLEVGKSARHAQAASHAVATKPRAPTGWTAVFPSELYAAVLLASTGGWPAGAALPLGGLAATVVGVYSLSWVTYRRLLETPAVRSSRSARRGGLRGLRSLSFLGLRPEVSAVAMAQVRQVLRTVSGKMGVFFSPVFALLFGVIFLRLREAPPAVLPFAGGALTFLSGAMALLSLQPVLLNQFAVDGPGLTLQLLSPLSDRDLVRGKVAGGAILIGIPTTLAIATSFAVAPRTIPLLWPAAVLAVVSAYCMIGPAGALASAVFPKKADLGKVGRMAKPHQGAALLATVLTGIALAPPVGIVLLSVFLHSGLVGLVLMLVWGAIAAAIGLGIVKAAATALGARRENIALVVAGR